MLVLYISKKFSVKFLNLKLLISIKKAITTLEDSTPQFRKCLPLFEASPFSTFQGLLNPTGPPPSWVLPFLLLFVLCLILVPGSHWIQMSNVCLEGFFFPEQRYRYLNLRGLIDWYKILGTSQ